MDVRIGLIQNVKEIELQLDDDADPAALREQVDVALKDGGTLWLTDRKGRQVGVSAEKLAYVEIGSPDDARRIGFGS
ncbi:MAG: DUF3107 domain-containing protein [Acidimicrobiales bacterium]